MFTLIEYCDLDWFKPINVDLQILVLNNLKIWGILFAYESCFKKILHEYALFDRYIHTLNHIGIPIKTYGVDYQWELLKAIVRKRGE